MAHDTDTQERRSPPPNRPGTAGPPFSYPQADENDPPPPGLEPEQRPATRWWGGRRRGNAVDLLPLAVALVAAILFFTGWFAGWWF